MKNNFMKIALRCARRAAAHDDVPVGAVIVRRVEPKVGCLCPKGTGDLGTRSPHLDSARCEIIARGDNQVQIRRNPTLHAEIVAINRACKKMGAKFLDDCEIFVSLEPCAMCAAAISYARIKKIHFAARDEKGGALFSNAKIFESDRHLFRPEVCEVPEFAGESAELLKQFFKAKRV